MKKCIFALMLASMLLLSACHYLDGDRSFVTQKDDNYIFQIDEPVILSTPGDPSPWATIEIKNAIVLTQEPVSVDSQYLSEPAQAIVQVNYLITKEDESSSTSISGSDLDCYDSAGNYCPRVDSKQLPCDPVYTGYNSFLVAVPVKDNYIDVRLALNNRFEDDEERRFATIRCYYGVGEVEIDPAINNTLTGTLIWLVLLTVVCFIVSISLLRKSKRLRRELEDLKVQYPPQPEPEPPKKPEAEPIEKSAEEPEVAEESALELPPPAQPLPLPGPTEDTPKERSDEQ